MSGRDIGAIMPEISDLLDEAHRQPEKITQGEIPLLRRDELRRTFLVRVAIERIGDQETGLF
ncbi:MAG: hypothetical protein H6860_00750 [Rhodospirillales bacterium]|nr:hypothetical protein [Rhodospirillales bacterium]